MIRGIGGTRVLLMVDGKRDVPALQDLIQSISAPEDALDQLLGLGLIALLGVTLRL